MCEFMGLDLPAGEINSAPGAGCHTGVEIGHEECNKRDPRKEKPDSLSA